MYLFIFIFLDNNSNAISCTSALLHSDESLSTLGPSPGFPTSSFKQFAILINRTFLSIVRDQVTPTRLVFYLYGQMYLNEKE